MTQAEQIAAIKASCTPLRNAAATQIDNGFLITGNTRWLDPESGAVQLEDNRQSATDDPVKAGTLVAAWLTGGTFLPA